MAQVLNVRQPKTTPPPPNALLRRATRRLHVRIDKQSVLAPLIRPGITLELYAKAMVALKSAYEEIDSVLLQSSALCPTTLACYMPRAPKIDRDLKALDVRFASLRPARPGLELKLPETEAAYLGIRYVVEGAQLGARFIFGQLSSTFGASIHEFGTFWNPEFYPQGSWPELLNSLTRVESRDGVARCVRAARATFRHMDLCLGSNECAVV